MAKPQLNCSVIVQALPEQTQAERAIYAYSYQITIENTGDITAQVIARHWRITDANNLVQEVQGLALVAPRAQRLS